MRYPYILALSGCLSACSASSPVAIHHWSKSQLEKTADAVEALPDDSPIIPILNDCAALRCQLDASVCKK